MNKYCIGLLIIAFVYICFQNRGIKEGVDNAPKMDVPKRIIPKEFQDILRSSKYGDIKLITKKEAKTKGKILHHRSSNLDALKAKSNFELCGDSGGLHSCDVKYRKPPPIDQRYLTLPPAKLDPSDMYNHLSLCPQAYATNMKKLKKKTTIGQYSGYTDNAYIDRTRYIDTKKGKEPLPVNPDFFMPGGGTYA